MKRAAEAKGRQGVEPKKPVGLRAQKPVGLRTASPVGLVEAVRGFVTRALSRWEEIAFILLFIVFVRFAIEVLMSLH